MNVLTIGETKAFPVSNGLMCFSQQFSSSFGGSESNFVNGLFRFGHEVGWISRIGKNDEFKKALVSHSDDDVMR